MSNIEDIQKKRDKAARVTEEKGWIHADNPSWDDIDYLLSRLTASGAEDVRDSAIHLLEALCAARDLLCAAQKQAGWLPEQQAYSATMTATEMQVAQGITSLDNIIREEQIALFTTTPTQSGARCGECGHDLKLPRQPNGWCAEVVRDAGGGLVYCGCKCVCPAAPEARRWTANCNHPPNERHYPECASASESSICKNCKVSIYKSGERWYHALTATTSCEVHLVAEPGTPTLGEAASQIARACAYEACRYFDELYLASAERRAKGYGFTSADTQPQVLTERLLPFVVQYLPPTEVTPVAGYMHEDELPHDMPQEDYDKWYAQSCLSDGARGVRVGPRYPFVTPGQGARHYHCSCGAALNADEYIEHYFEQGHDRGERVK